MIKLNKIFYLFLLIIITLLYFAIFRPKYLNLLDYKTRKVISLVKAINDDDIEKVRNIAKNGKVIIDSHAYEGSTPLLIATGNNRDECVEILLKNGANPNSYDLTSKLSPLHVSSENNNVNIVKLLIKYGADVNNYANTLYFNTPLHIAAFNDSSEVVTILLANGANINIHNDYTLGKTPLHLAVMNNSINSIKILLDKGADRNIKDNEGNTPVCPAPVDLAQTEKVSQLLRRESRK